MKLIIIFKLISCLILICTNSNAEILKIKCEDGWWDEIIYTHKINKIFVPRVGDVIFQSIDEKTLQWSSDFNEGVINIFSGKAIITKDKYNGKLLGDEFNCLIFSK